jgi:hypothetical protein
MHCVAAVKEQAEHSSSDNGLGCSWSGRNYWRLANTELFGAVEAVEYGKMASNTAKQRELIFDRCSHRDG